jgi:hypothetical protein
MFSSCRKFLFISEATSGLLGGYVAVVRHFRARGPSMASADDYLGMVFGSFAVERIIGAGAEAEVFQVVHRGSGRRYVMRLDANDEETWKGKPLNPPRNSTLEINNVRGSWFGSINYHEQGVDRRQKRSSFWLFGRSKEPAFVFNVANIYAVKNLRYLIPVSSPFSLRGSLPIDTILSAAPADDLNFFEMWEDVVLQMLGDAHIADTGGLSEDKWGETWRTLLGGPILCDAMRRYMNGGTLSVASKDAIIARISKSDGEGSELAENLLLRLCGAVSRGRVSMDAAKTTARGIAFRQNLTIHELDQILACWNVMRKSLLPPKRSMAILSEVLSSLKDQPPAMADQSDEFVYTRPEGPREDFNTFIERHELNKYSLFLQELAGADQPFPTLGAAS